MWYVTLAVEVCSEKISVSSTLSMSGEGFSISVLRKLQYLLFSDSF